MVDAIVADDATVAVGAIVAAAVAVVEWVVWVWLVDVTVSHFDEFPGL